MENGTTGKYFNMTWRPHITVAAIIERGSRFLMVAENCEGEIVINQPAGHLEQNETLVEAVIRETLEENSVAYQSLRRHWRLSMDKCTATTHVYTYSLRRTLYRTRTHAQARRRYSQGIMANTR